MILNEGPGRFIVIEGLDGAGTTTQARLLHDHLLKATGMAYLTQEPSRGPAGAQIRSILTRRLKADRQTLALLFATDRLDHLYCRNNGIAHRLAGGWHVVCDRYYLSSLAYQSLDVEKRWIYQLNYLCVRPDLTIFLDVPVETCMQRITASRGFHYELFENLEALRTVAGRYQEVIEGLRSFSENIQVVKGDLPIERVWGFVSRRVEPLLVADWLPSQKQRALLQSNQLMSVFSDLAAEREDLFLLSIRSINNGYQALFAHAERERPIPVNFFTTGMIVPQGPLDYQLKLKEIVREVRIKMYGRPWA